MDVRRRLSPAGHDRSAWHYARVLTIGTLVAFRIYQLGFHGWISAPLSIMRRSFAQKCAHSWWASCAAHSCPGRVTRMTTWRVPAASSWTVRPGPIRWAGES